MSASYFDLLKYAATGIASPDMTYYDRMRASTLMGGAVQTLTGQPPLSFKADGSPITVWSMKGNGEQTGTPTPDNPIQPEFVGVRTANLAPPLSEWNNGYIASNGSVQPQSSGQQQEKYSPMIPVSASTTYKFSCDGGFPKGESYAWKTAALYDSSGTFISRLEAGTSVDAFTLNTTATTAFVVLMCRTFGEPLKTMLNTGSTALPYEPTNGYKIPLTCAETVPVYLGTTQTVRRIKKLVLDGTEDWHAAAMSGLVETARFYIRINNAGVSNNALFSSHFQASSGNEDIAHIRLGTDAEGVFNVLYVFVPVSIATTVTELTSWLAAQYANGTPVVVWYVLATPETGIVNEPLCKIGTYCDELHSTIPIPTAKGQNTLTVGTTLQPSEMTITYKG